jgi:hypothetical protein
MSGDKRERERVNCWGGEKREQRKEKRVTEGKALYIKRVEDGREGFSGTGGGRALWR